MTTNNEAWIKNLILELIETPNLDKAAKKWDKPNKGKRTISHLNRLRNF